MKNSEELPEEDIELERLFDVADKQLLAELLVYPNRPEMVETCDYVYTDEKTGKLVRGTIDSNILRPYKITIDEHLLSLNKKAVERGNAYHQAKEELLTHFSNIDEEILAQHIESILRHQETNKGC